MAAEAPSHAAPVRSWPRHSWQQPANSSAAITMSNCRLSRGDTKNRPASVTPIPRMPHQRPDSPINDGPPVNRQAQMNATVVAMMLTRYQPNKDGNGGKFASGTESMAIAGGYV
jgi:hypothetical protein